MRYEITDLTSAKEFKEYIKDVDNYKIIEINGEKIVKTEDCEVVIPKRYNYLLNRLKSSTPKQSDDEVLIYGKNDTKGITALEVNNDTYTLFFTDGSTQRNKTEHWILCNKNIKGKLIELEGNLHYKYLALFNNKKSKSDFYRKYSNIFDLYTVWNDADSILLREGYTLFKDLKVNDVSVLSFDIESSGLTKDETSKVFVITNTLKKSGKITKKLFRVDRYNSDIEMIEDWCKWVVEVDPVVINGHNIYGYDLPYIQHCYSYRDGGDDKLPLGKDHKPIFISKKTSEFRVSGDQSWSYNQIRIYGRHIVDGMFLAVRYDIGKQYPSWGLKAIAEYEGIVKEDRQFYDASKIADNWDNLEEREKIVKYCEHDSDDSLALYEIMIPSMFYMTQYVPKTFQFMGTSASGAQLNAIMVRAYLQQGHSVPKANPSRSIGGGISFGVPGVHKNVFKIDVKSEYPSIIRQYRVYPVEKDPCMYYTKMVDYFTEKRFEQKRLHKETGDKHYDDLQAASKIFINSAYGMTSTTGLNFNDYNCADFITGMGRQVIKETIKWATGKNVTDWTEYDKIEQDSIYDNELFSCTTYADFAKRKGLYK